MAEKNNKYAKLFNVYQRIKKLGVDSKAETVKFSYDYVSLSKFKKIVDPVLEEQKIGYIQPLRIIDGKNCLETIVYDEETGEEIVASYIILKPRSETNPQILKTGELQSHTLDDTCYSQSLVSLVIKMMIACY